MVGKEWDVVKVNGRAESTNIIDRRNALPPLLRSFEFDGKTIGLDMTGPNPHNGGVLTDQQAIGKYLSDHSYYGLPDNQQTHLASSSLDPRVVDTIIAEAGNNVAGQRAVAAAIINRAKAQGKTPLQIVQQHGQFEGYSNPGSASVKAQQIASVRQNATKAFNDVLTGAVADPLKGGKDFRADASAAGLHAPHGTVSIGGNTFALGNAPSSAVAAIDAVAPVPRSIPTSLSAYADTPAVAMPPLPLPRPSNPEGIRSVEINPDGTLKQSLTDALAARFGNSTARTGADTSIYDTVSGYTPAFQSPAPLASFVSEDHPRSNAVRPPLPRLSQVPQALTSRSVHTVQIDPFTGNPVGSNTPFVSADHPISNAVAPKTIYYNSTAGNVALPKGVVPASVTRDLASIAGSQMNRSGSPDDRQAPSPQIAPTPLPARPSALSSPYIQRNSNDVVRSVPFVPPTPSPSHYTDASNPLYIDRLGLTVGPPVAPAVQAIQQAAPTTRQVLNPAYAKWVANPVAVSKLQDIHDFRDDATMAAQGSAARLPAPPKYIRVPVPGSSPQVPLPRPRPQLLPVQQPQATGGLLGLLFPGGFGGGPSIVSAPVGGNPNITYGPVIAAGNFAEGSPNASFEKQNGMGSVTKSMAASTRWNGGY